MNDGELFDVTKTTISRADAAALRLPYETFVRLTKMVQNADSMQIGPAVISALDNLPGARLELFGPSHSFTVLALLPDTPLAEIRLQAEPLSSLGNEAIVLFEGPDDDRSWSRILRAMAMVEGVAHFGQWCSDESGEE
jgi:hypothetical protein